MTAPHHLAGSYVTALQATFVTAVVTGAVKSMIFKKASRLLQLILAAVLCASVSMAPTKTMAGEARAAVATNFGQTATALAKAFNASGQHVIKISTGSTGQLYSQIVNAAPYDVFLSADAERPRLAVAAGLAVKQSRMTYALGRLALYAGADQSVTQWQRLTQSDVSRIALANPNTAPYGLAAQQVLKSLEIEQKVASHLVFGNNVAQAFQFIESGNASIGFVAVSQVINQSPQSYWVVDESLYQLIQQDAVVLTRGQNNPAATAFLTYLASAPARALILNHGYNLTDDTTSVNEPAQ